MEQMEDWTSQLSEANSSLGEL
jgi:uncharacterized protein YoxC